MTTPTGKTYLPTAVVQLRQLCNFLTNHGATIIAATELLSPTDVTAMTEAIVAVQAACTLFEKVHSLFDPYYGKEEARPEP